MLGVSGLGFRDMIFRGDPVTTVAGPKVSNASPNPATVRTGREPGEHRAVLARRQKGLENHDFRLDRYPMRYPASAIHCESPVNLPFLWPRADV